jgi:hypothetical protein
MNTPSINPYEPPAGDSKSRYDPEKQTYEQIRRRVSRPGTALMIMASIWSVFPAIALVSMVLELAVGGLSFKRIVPDFILMGSYFACLLVIAIGGAKMAFMESYPTARYGALLSCIPVISPFIVWGIPFGIWALVLLFDPEVKAAFEAKKAGKLDEFFDDEGR